MSLLLNFSIGGHDDFGLSQSPALLEEKTRFSIRVPR